ncbi:MAG: GUN4 domain-containing protein [Stigonema ocellatum SAG 48.90 = DSM 106950]|nr:GUN4 domain-containing protein [Stigonema ocellatum SAG 48.90 = DSM 106950]
MSYCLNPNCPHPSSNSVDVKFCACCGSKLLLAERYRAIKQIGQGGFGRTFKAIDEYKPSQPRCVIKQFFPRVQRTHNVEKASDFFKVEAAQLDELGKTHSQLPELLAYFNQDNQEYLVQEFIDGQNLADEIAQNGTFNEDKIIALLNNLLPVLQFVHDKQVIHRDIKPENIIRRSDGELVLVDFGAAKTLKPTALSVTGTVIGTAGYAAPEQAMGKATFASDIYSLGVTCLNLLTYIEPFELFDVMEGEWVWRDYLLTKVSNSLAQVLDKMIEGAVKHRYQTAIEVMQALNPTNTKTQPIVINPNQSATSIVSDNLNSDVGVDYTRLRNLLAAGNWKDADYETYLVILKVVVRVDGDWIRDKKLLNFPCTDLGTIDRLWVKYSNGHFGFSIQKKIYLEVGGIPDGKFYQEAWKKFSDSVGWSKGWTMSLIIRYNEVIFDTSAPRGHLPFAHCYNVLGVYWGWLHFSRIETCILWKQSAIDVEIASE